VKKIREGTFADFAKLDIRVGEFEKVWVEE